MSNKPNVPGAGGHDPSCGIATRPFHGEMTDSERESRSWGYWSAKLLAQASVAADWRGRPWGISASDQSRSDDSMVWTSDQPQLQRVAAGTMRQFSTLEMNGHPQSCHEEQVGRRDVEYLSDMPIQEALLHMESQDAVAIDRLIDDGCPNVSY